MSENTVNISGNEVGSVTEGLPKRRRRGGPMTTNQMIALFREIVEGPKEKKQ